MQSTVNQTCALKYNKEVFRSFLLATNNGCFTVLHRVVYLHNYRISTPLSGLSPGKQQYVVTVPESDSLSHMSEEFLYN